MKTIIEFCDCRGAHAPDCRLALRLRIKERICAERGIISYIPEDVVQEIDRAITEAERTLGE